MCLFARLSSTTSTRRADSIESLNIWLTNEQGDQHAIAQPYLWRSGREEVVPGPFRMRRTIRPIRWPETIKETSSPHPDNQDEQQWRVTVLTKSITWRTCMSKRADRTSESPFFPTNGLYAFTTTSPMCLAITVRARLIKKLIY